MCLLGVGGGHCRVVVWPGCLFFLEAAGRVGRRGRGFTTGVVRSQPISLRPSEGYRPIHRGGVFQLRAALLVWLANGREGDGLVDGVRGPGLGETPEPLPSCVWCARGLVVCGRSSLVTGSVPPASAAYTDCRRPRTGKHSTEREVTPPPRSLTRLIPCYCVKDKVGGRGAER